jgi:hypothetical protein
MHDRLQRAHWRVVVYFLITVCFGLGLLVVFFGWRRNPFLAKYERVQMGMTQQEVEALLGPPADEDDAGGSLGPPPHVCVWVEGREMICVAFDADHPVGNRNKVAFKKKYLPQTSLEKVSEGLRGSSPDWP